MSFPFMIQYSGGPGVTDPALSTGGPRATEFRPRPVPHGITSQSGSITGLTILEVWGAYPELDIDLRWRGDLVPQRLQFRVTGFLFQDLNITLNEGLKTFCIAGDKPGSGIVVSFDTDVATNTFQTLGVTLNTQYDLTITSLAETTPVLSPVGVTYDPVEGWGFPYHLISGIQFLFGYGVPASVVGIDSTGNSSGWIRLEGTNLLVRVNGETVTQTNVTQTGPLLFQGTDWAVGLYVDADLLASIGGTGYFWVSPVNTRYFKNVPAQSPASEQVGLYLTNLSDTAVAPKVALNAALSSVWGSYSIAILSTEETLGDGVFTGVLSTDLEFGYSSGDWDTLNATTFETLPEVPAGLSLGSALRVSGSFGGTIPAPVESQFDLIFGV